MIRLVAEAYLALDGTFKALTFKQGWQSEIDVSLTGFWHSFLAIIPAMAMLAGILIAADHIGGSFNEAAIWWIFWLSWLVFPGAAAVATVVLGVRERFVPWVVMHNWTVVWLYGILTLLWALLTAGLISREFFEFANFIYLYFRVLVHWRIAYVSLGLPTITAALAAAVPIVVYEIAQAIIYRAYTAPAAG